MNGQAAKIYVVQNDSSFKQQLSFDPIFLCAVIGRLLIHFLLSEHKDGASHFVVSSKKMGGSLVQYHSRLVQKVCSKVG